MLDKLPLDILSQCILNPLLIHGFPVNISCRPIPSWEHSFCRSGVKTLSSTDRSLFGVSRGIRNVSLATFWTRNSFYVNAKRRTSCKRSAKILLRQTEEVRSLIRRIEVDVLIFCGPKFQNWISGIEPLINLKGLSSKTLDISLLARRNTRQNIHYELSIPSQQMILREFRRVLSWRFRKMNPHQFKLRYDLYTTYCSNYAHCSWERVLCFPEDCYKWLPLLCTEYHKMKLRSRGTSQEARAVAIDFRR